jgi:hypothetical protein
MSKFNSKALRQIAEDILEKIAENEDVPDNLRGDFATSLVRQWITYDGNATLFFGEKQIYFVLSSPSPEQYHVVSEPETPGWISQLNEHWKISSDDLPEVIEQLNRGQSAEVINRDGVPLRLWVNPKDRNRGVEPPAKDYRKIAKYELKPKLKTARELDELDELACSVAMQWQQYEGHACLFLSAGCLRLVLTEKEDGGCQVVTVTRPIQLHPILSSLGIPADDIPDVIARINLGQEVEFQNREGVSAILWHDPKAERIRVRPKVDSIRKPKFPLGVIEIHKKAAQALARSGQEASYFLERHASQDWGDIGDKATAENNHRLKTGQDVVSCYHTKLGEKILVCTLADRRKTVVYV